MVADGDGDGVAVGGAGDDDVLAVAVLDGVDEEVAQDAFDAAPVDLGHARFAGQLQDDLAALALRQALYVADDAQDEVAHVEGLGVQCRGPGVVAADLQQVGEQRLEPLQLALQQLGGPSDGGVVEGVAVLVEHVGRDPDGGQRRAELVGDVGDELALHLRQVLQFADLLLEVGGHVVEGAG